MPWVWESGLAAESFDVVVSNPPYIASGDIAGLAPEVRDHEPRLALDGGLDGLDAYRRLAPEILNVLVPGGRFAVEVGLGQAPAVSDLFADAGAAALSIHRDLSDHDRIVAGERSL
jgi:release factor glutamine methyltransferase